MLETVERLREVTSAALHRREVDFAVEATLLLSCALYRMGRDEEARREALRVALSAGECITLIGHRTRPPRSL